MSINNGGNQPKQFVSSTEESLIPSNEVKELKRESSSLLHGDQILDQLAKETLTQVAKPVDLHAELAKIAKKTNLGESVVLDASEIKLFARTEPEEISEYLKIAKPNEDFVQRKICRAVFKTLHTFEKESNEDNIIELKDDFKKLMNISVHSRCDSEVVQMIQESKKTKEIFKEYLTERNAKFFKEEEQIVPGSQKFCGSKGNCVAMSSDFVATYLNRIKQIKPEELEYTHIVAITKEIGERYLTSSKEFREKQKSYKATNAYSFLVQEHLLAGITFPLRSGNEEALQDLAKLENGPYLFTFNLKGGGHQIAFIKSNEGMVFYDPNFGSFKVKNIGRLVNILQTLYEQVQITSCFRAAPMQEVSREQLIRSYRMCSFLPDVKIPYLPEQLKSDRAFWKEMLAQNKFMLRFVPAEILDSELCCIAALTTWPYGKLDHNLIPEKIRGEVYWLMVKKNASNLSKVPEAWVTKEICWQAIQQEIYTFDLVPKNMLNQQMIDYVVKMALKGGLIDDNQRAIERIPEKYITKAMCRALLADPQFTEMAYRYLVSPYGSRTIYYQLPPIYKAVAPEVIKKFKQKFSKDKNFKQITQSLTKP